MFSCTTSLNQFHSLGEFRLNGKIFTIFAIITSVNYLNFHVDFRLKFFCRFFFCQKKVRHHCSRLISGWIGNRGMSRCWDNHLHRQWLGKKIGCQRIRILQVQPNIYRGTRRQKSPLHCLLRARKSQAKGERLSNLSNLSLNAFKHEQMQLAPLKLFILF